VITALVIRRFNCKENGTAGNVEVAGLVDLPVLPPHGVTLVLRGWYGRGERRDGASVVMARLKACPSPRPAGVYPVPFEIRTSTEPGSRFERVLDEPGWKRLQEA
jgi:hypothetical protein